MKRREGRSLITIELGLMFYACRKLIVQAMLNNVGEVNGGEYISLLMAPITPGGVAVLIKKNTPLMVENITKCTNGRYIVCDLINVNNMQNKVTLFNIYAPNQDSPEFYTGIEELVYKAQSHKMLIGDFNLTLRPELDRLNTVERNVRAVRKLQTIMLEWNLTDVWRVRNPSTRKYTWDKLVANQTLNASRINNVLVSEGLTTLVKNVTHLTGIHSDHTALFCAISLEQNERGGRLLETKLFPTNRSGVLKTNKGTNKTEKK